MRRNKHSDGHLQSPYHVMICHAKNLTPTSPDRNKLYVAPESPRLNPHTKSLPTLILLSSLLQSIGTALPHQQCHSSAPSPGPSPAQHRPPPASPRPFSSVSPRSRPAPFPHNQPPSAPATRHPCPPRPQTGPICRSKPSRRRPRAAAATRTRTTTSRPPAGSSASRPARSTRPRAGRLSGCTASGAAWRSQSSRMLSSQILRTFVSFHRVQAVEPTTWMAFLFRVLYWRAGEGEGKSHH